MLPDERTFVALVDRALLRARLLAVAEALACAAGVTAVAPVEAAVLVFVLVVTLRLRHWSRPVVVERLERATPASRNLLVTASEVSRGRLAVVDRVRDRVFADVSKVAVDFTRAVPASPLAWCAAASAVVWGLALGAGRVESTVARFVAPASSSQAAGRATSMRIAVALHPPAYTRLAESQAVDPAELRAIEGSVATLSVDTASPRITIDHDGVVTALTPDSAGSFSTRLTLMKTGYVIVAAENGDRRTLPVVVAPDALPTVRITAPGRDLVYSSDSASIAFTARARDDYGLRSLALRYTKVSGSGEEFEFSEGEIPLKLSAASARDWTGTAARTLAELGLHEGDMLVYRAAATDERPGDGRAESDAFFVEISRLGVAAGDAFTLPEQETKYALSQQMLIVKTDRLVRQRASLPSDQFGETSLNLAVEQRMIRAEFVFMLGGEVEDEEVEAERSVELQSGRLANRGQSDLRAATIAMSQAEKLLTAGNPTDALVAERNAVTALQRAFARDRYILRASPSRVDLDPKRRLTGDLSKASGWTRVLPDTPGNRRAAQLQDLLRGLSDLARNGDRSRALVLAETALRIDPNSEPLRKAAAVLQAGGIDEAIAAVTEETKRSLFAAPALSTDVAPGLRRALAERAK